MNTYHSNLRPGTVWRHIDGGTYIVDRMVVVHEPHASGLGYSWLEGVQYREFGNRDPRFFVRTLRDFCDRFTEVVEG